MSIGSLWHPSASFRISDVTVDPERRALFRNEKMLEIPEHYVAVLICLAQRPQTTVSREDLINAMGEGAISGDVLNKAIQELRRILGSDAIRTERGRGYRLMRIPEFDIPTSQPKAEASRAEYAEPQLAMWTSCGEDGEPGIHINRKDGTFITWAKLLPEISDLLERVDRLSLGSTARPAPYKDRPNYIVQVLDPAGIEVANIWFGVDPYHQWRFDGLVRIGWGDSSGKTMVWDVFQRYSDGGYRRVAKY